MIYWTTVPYSNGIIRIREDYVSDDICAYKNKREIKIPLYTQQEVTKRKMAFKTGLKKVAYG